MGVREEATKLHESGFNCAQSVLGSCNKNFNLDEKSALALSAGFGGGLRCGEICGAVSGGVMALGLAYPFNDAKDLTAKDKIAALAKAYTSAFQEKYGCLRCEELKGDKSKCPAYIEYAAELAETMITKERD